MGLGHGFKLGTPGSAVRHASVVRHVSQCASSTVHQRHVIWLMWKKQIMATSTWPRAKPLHICRLVLRSFPVPGYQIKDEETGMEHVFPQ